MPFQSVLGCAEAVVRYTCNLQLCTMTFYGFHPSVYDQQAINTLATNMDIWATQNFKNLLSNEANYTGVHVRGLTNITDLEATVITGAGLGVLVSPPMPNSVALCVKRLSGFSGRSARGRVFWPVARTQIATNEDFILQASRDQIVAALNSVKTSMTAGGWTEVIVSRYSHGAIRPEGVFYNVQLYTTTDLVLDTQRRRLTAH